jgi:hypothetical protein
MGLLFPEKESIMYDPTAGRFISRDPVAADTNLYRYAGNNPVTATDPSGLQQMAAPARRGRVIKQGDIELVNKPIKVIVESIQFREKELMQPGLAAAAIKEFSEAFKENFADKAVLAALSLVYVEKNVIDFVIGSYLFGYEFTGKKDKGSIIQVVSRRTTYYGKDGKIRYSIPETTIEGFKVLPIPGQKRGRSLVDFHGGHLDVNLDKDSRVTRLITLQVGYGTYNKQEVKASYEKFSTDSADETNIQWTNKDRLTVYTIYFEIDANGRWDIQAPGVDRAGNWKRPQPKKP